MIDYQYYINIKIQIMHDCVTKLRLIRVKPRSKKLQHRVDLTAMVSVSFLLIVFYMVTIELSKPKALNLGMFDKHYSNVGMGTYCGMKNYRTATLLLDECNRVIYYHGLANSPHEKPKVLHYGKNSIRKELLYYNRRMQELHGIDRGAIVIIKPTEKSNFGNLVAILDEMVITNISTYAVVNNVTPEEVKMLSLK